MENTKFRANGVGKAILYLNEEGKWKSTGKKTFGEAREWYYHQKPQDELTFKVFTKGFFTDESEGTFKYLQKMTGRHPYKEWWNSNNHRLNSYLLPFFGDTPMYQINTKMIQSWYLSFKGVYRDNLDPQTKKKILDCLSTIMDYAVYSGVIQSNPVKAVIRMKVSDTGRDPYTNEELARMFPENDVELLSIWGGLKWATYFMIMRDTGWRPGEIGALTSDGYIPELNGVYTTQSVNSYEKRIQDSIKTSEKGYKYRIGILSEQTGGLLRMLINQTEENELLFTSYRGKLLKSDCARIMFKKRMDSLGIDTTGRPPYALRTTFMTNVAKKMTREQVEELMGHRQWRACYDKRTAEDVLEKIIKSQSAN